MGGFIIFNGAQFHLLVNHLPVVGFLGIILALIAAMVLRNLELKRFLLFATVIVGLSALAPYFTGEEAEEVVEHLPGVNKDQIHDHEELAEKATVLSVLTAVAAALALTLQRRRPETLKWSVLVVLLLSVLAAAIMGATAHLGGRIIHSEIRLN